jgi:hypothetical protein
MAPRSLLIVSSFGLFIPVSILATEGKEIPDFSANSCCVQLRAERPARIAAAITWASETEIIKIILPDVFFVF